MDLTPDETYCDLDAIPESNVLDLPPDSARDVTSSCCTDDEFQQRIRTEKDEICIQTSICNESARGCNHMVCENCGHPNPFWTQYKTWSHHMDVQPAPQHTAQEIDSTTTQRLLEARNHQLAQTMAKLDTNVAFFRNRIAKLQDELQEKEALVQELTLQVRKADIGTDEMSFMVQTLQHQLNSVAVGKRGQLSMDMIRQTLANHTKEAYRLVQILEIRNVTATVLGPMAKKVRRLKTDAKVLKRVVMDKLASFQRALLMDSDILTQLIVHFANDTTAPSFPTTSGEISLTAAVPKPEIKLIKSPPISLCLEPHLSETSLAHLQSIVGQLAICISRMVAVAGMSIEIPRMVFSRDRSQQLNNIQAMLSALYTRLDIKVAELSQRVQTEHEEINGQQLQRMAKEQENIQKQVTTCAELMVKAQTDPSAAKQLTEAFAKAEASMEARNTHPEFPTMVDKGCQCTLLPLSKDAKERAAGNTSTTKPTAAFTKGMRQDPQLSNIPTVNALSESRSSPQGKAAPPTPEDPLQKTIGSIKTLLETSTHQGPWRQKLEALMDEANTLSLDDFRKGHLSAPNKRHVSDDLKAVQRFQQWKLRQKVTMAKQQFVLEGLFQGLKGYYVDSCPSSQPTDIIAEEQAPIIEQVVKSRVNIQQQAHRPSKVAYPMGTWGDLAKPPSTPLMSSPITYHPSTFKSMTELMEMPLKVPMANGNGTKLHPLTQTPAPMMNCGSEVHGEHLDEYVSNSGISSHRMGYKHSKLVAPNEVHRTPRMPARQLSCTAEMPEAGGVIPNTINSVISVPLTNEYVPKSLTHRLPTGSPKLRPIHSSPSYSTAPVNDVDEAVRLPRPHPLGFPP